MIANKMKGKHIQSKLMRIITTPFRILCKARDAYVKGITNCSDRVGYGHSNMAQYSLPKSFSVGSSMSANDGDDYRELIRAASVRSLGHRNEAEMYLQEAVKKIQATKNMESKALPKSVSVGMGFMGRIDEDSPCCEFDDEGSVKAKAKAELMYPRSKSVAVAKSVAF